MPVTQLLTVSLLTIELVGKADFSHLSGVISQFDFRPSILCFSTLISGNPLVYLTGFGSRQWIKSIANWLARTDWARIWSPCSLMMFTSLVICPSSPFSIEECYQLPPAFLLHSKRPSNASLISPWRPYPTTQEAVLASLPAPHHLQPHHPTAKASWLDLSRNLHPKLADLLL